MVAANDLAVAAGVMVGMDRREAEGLIPAGRSHERDLAAEAVRFEPVLAVVEELIPRVEVVEPGWLFIPVDGAVRYYGGEAPLLDRVAKEVDRVIGPGGRFGLAGGPFAAHLAAQVADPVQIVDDDAAFLSDVRVTALGTEHLVATFNWLGIQTLGDLARLPRGTIASRFGRDGLAAHRLASGEDRMPSPRSIPPDLAVESRFEDPLEILEQVGFAARRLANQLMRALRPHGIAPHRIEVEAEAADGTIRNRVWRSADPFTEDTLSERVWWQLRAWTESAGVPGGLIRLRLAPEDLSGDGRQMALFEDVAAQIEATRALARAQAIVGPDAVLEPRPRGGRNPGDRVSWERWGEAPDTTDTDLASPWPGSIPSPSPTLLPPVPRPLDVEWDRGTPVRVRLGSRWEPVLSWAGPWRQVGRWWAEEPAVLHLQIVTSAGAMLCVVREGRTSLVGVYD